MSIYTGAVVARPRPARAPHRGPGVLPQLLLALVCSGYATGAALGWGSPRIALFMGDFGLSAAAFTAAVSSLRYARTRQSRFRPAWLMFGASSFMAGLGNGVWGWYEVVLRQPVPSPSPADFCFLLFAPPAIVGLLILAKRPVTRAGWICLGLDSWLIGGSLLTISWSLALSHTADQDGETVPGVALSLAYPLLDIALVSMVLVLHFRRSAANRSAINTAIAALAMTVLCDALFTSPLLHDSYRSGQILDAGWFAGSLLLAYAPWVGRREAAAAEEVREAAVAGPPAGRGPQLSALTPYLAAGVCTLGILYNVLNGGHVDRVVLTTACTVVLALVVRQAIMLLDNISLAQELAQKENHFRSLVQGSSDVIMIAAPNGVLRYVSPAAARVYGRRAEELVGSELSALIHPEDLGRVLHEVRRFLAAPPGESPSTRIECRFRAGGPRAETGDGSGDGGWLNVESTVNRHHGGLIFNSRDVTERVRLQAQLQHNASHDWLTDLPNRALFTERVRQALSGRRASDQGTAVLFIDLDGFKSVNDTVGHQGGDELLVEAARRLADAVRTADTASRLGGDEFAALIVGDGSGRTRREARILEVADRLRAKLSEPYPLTAGEVRVTPSIGVAFAEPGIKPAELMRHADMAMYRAKQAGKARVELYAPQLPSEAVRRGGRTARVGSALRDGQFSLHHQPVVELATGRVAAVAAHARWRSAQGIVHTPAEFLRAAEQGGPDGARTAELGRWLVEEAVQRAAERYGAGFSVPVSVRLPALRLTDRSLPPQTIAALLAGHGLPTGALTIELCDHDPRVGLDELERRLVALRHLGVRIGLDGFGAGHAAIGALRRLPVDVLKLDRSLVEGLDESVRLRKITAGLLRIAADLGLDSVAEGVDQPEQIRTLRDMGCTHGQGLAFSGPLDEQQLRRALGSGPFAVGVPDGGAPDVDSAIALT